LNHNIFLSKIKAKLKNFPFGHMMQDFIEHFDWAIPSHRLLKINIFCKTGLIGNSFFKKI